MAYCTYTDLLVDVFEKDLTELVDDKNESTAEEPFSESMINLINSFIAKADAVIDSYCGGIYKLPFNPVPETIKNLSVAIATYYIFSRPRDLDGDNPKRQKYEDAIKLLERISEGRVIIDTEPEPKVDDTIGISINKKSNDRMFDWVTLNKMV